MGGRDQSKRYFGRLKQALRIFHKSPYRNHPPMSESGQTRTSADVRSTSALSPIADISETWRHFRFVPLADSCAAAKIDSIRRRRGHAAGRLFRRLANG